MRQAYYIKHAQDIDTHIRGMEKKLANNQDSIERDFWLDLIKGAKKESQFMWRLAKIVKV